MSNVYGQICHFLSIFDKERHKQIREGVQKTFSYVIFYHPTPRISLSVRPSVPPSVTEKYRIVLANAYTMRTSQMYDAVKMKMIIIIHVRCDHHHDMMTIIIIMMDPCAIGYP